MQDYIQADGGSNWVHEKLIRRDHGIIRGTNTARIFTAQQQGYNLFRDRLKSEPFYDFLTEQVVRKIDQMVFSGFGEGCSQNYPFDKFTPKTIGWLGTR